MKFLSLACVTVATVAVLLGCGHKNNAGSIAQTSQTRNISSVINPQAAWAYDPGPSPDTAMGRELIDIVAKQPHMPGISEEITGDQKFRPPFGPTLWRMLQQPNSVKILFIGQDGTHIAEAAGRTATAGFGGRAQDMAAHFGVESSAAFINAFAFTIKGQYSSFGAPVIREENGSKKVSYESVVDNGVWLMSQDQNSPMVKWRNSLIDWIIRNNKDSLRLVVLFGGAAQDSIGTFIESRGGNVGAKYTLADLEAKKVRVPVFRSVSAGGNREMPVAIDKNDQDIFKTLGFNIRYSDLGIQVDRGADKPPRLVAAEEALQQAKSALSSRIDEIYPNLAIANAGLAQSGILHPAQIGGYDLSKINVGGRRTISLKGLRLSDGSTLRNDVLVAEFPHPTSLSSGSPAAAEQKVERSLELLKPYAQNGWQIQPDQGKVNKFASGEGYRYGRADIPPVFYDFGTPANRMVSVSSASRMTGKPNIVVIGTRERPDFDTVALNNMTKARSVDEVPPEEMFNARPRTTGTRYLFDMGPGEKMARIMKENLNMADIGKMKDGKSANASCRSPEPASQFNIKTHPICVGDFGHYRGTFNNPQVVILADPIGVDDILTSRALTGTRGQYLQGLMNDMGVEDRYLVIKTVPFGMDGATAEEWRVVMEKTREYRKKILAEVLKGSVKLIITDGRYASAETPALLRELRKEIAVVSIERDGAEENASGIRQAAQQINQLRKFNTFSSSGKMANIPRSHLGFFSRVWEGTSGTRVIDTKSATEKGTAFAIVVPEWAYKQNPVIQDREERGSVNTLKRTIEEQGIPREDERFQEFIRRRGNRDTRLEKVCYEDCRAHA